MWDIKGGLFQAQIILGVNFRLNGVKLFYLINFFYIPEYKNVHCEPLKIGIYC